MAGDAVRFYAGAGGVRDLLRVFDELGGAVGVVADVRAKIAAAEAKSGDVSFRFHHSMEDRCAPALSGLFERRANRLRIGGWRRLFRVDIHRTSYRERHIFNVGELGKPEIRGLRRQISRDVVAIPTSARKRRS